MSKRPTKRPSSRTTTCNWGSGRPASTRHSSSPGLLGRFGSPAHQSRGGPHPAARVLPETEDLCEGDDLQLDGAVSHCDRIDQCNRGAVLGQRHRTSHLAGLASVQFEVGTPTSHLGGGGEVQRQRLPQVDAGQLQSSEPCRLRVGRQDQAGGIGPCRDGQRLVCWREDAAVQLPIRGGVELTTADAQLAGFLTGEGWHVRIRSWLRRRVNRPLGSVDNSETATARASRCSACTTSPQGPSSPTTPAGRLHHQSARTIQTHWRAGSRSG